MQRCAAFLRGMNLGRRRITNDDLRVQVEALGFEDVRTFRASGNVILSAPADASIADVAQRLEAGLGEALAYDVPVFARSAEQLRAIAAFAPFEADAVAASNGKLQVMLLTAAPAAAARKEALALATATDRLAIEGTELYWLPSGGLLESPLDLKALAQLVGPTTTRTKGTIDLIAAKHFAD
ncbi:MAG TPA: DUF1697 domain-containing protein [Conexibacter sp.]|jgi:uncharacterized protein (DUF1697 family)|nr:DUF1697 domain-containing protein [Conexibacter sp.]